MRNLFLVFLSLYSINLFACGCGGDATFISSVDNFPILAQVKINELDRSNDDNYPDVVFKAKAEVLEIFKGKIENKTINLKNSMCYQNISLNQLKIGGIYIFLLQDQLDKDAPYTIGGCAPTGLQLFQDKLYQFEISEYVNIEHKFKYYMEYDEFYRKYKSIQ